MSLTTPPVKPLGKLFTLISVVNTILLWLKQDLQSELEPELVKSFVNLAIIDVSETPAVKESDDYGQIVKLPTQTSTVYDLYSYNLSGIAKIVSTTAGEVISLDSSEIENISRYPDKQNKIYWNKIGMNLSLYIGIGISNRGDLNMYYKTLPQLHTLDNELLDIRDNYISLIIARAKDYCKEHLGLAVPQTQAPA